MECEVVVRAARAHDWGARAALVARGVATHDFDAVVYFIFQELTLHLSVLCGAVLFIFAGASLAVCAAAPLVLAALVALAVLVSHRAIASQHAARLRSEEAGFVAEYRGPLCSGAPPALRVRGEGGDGGGAGAACRVVATVSLSEFQGASRSAWLHSLAVHPQWRRRGLGRALVAACRAHALRTGLDSLETATSTLQGAASALLHNAGWELRGSYHRRVVGDALTLPVLRLGLELPHA